MIVAEIAPKTGTEYLLIPKGAKFNPAQSCSRIELDMGQAVDRAIAEMLNLYLLRDGLSVDLTVDRLGIYSDGKIQSTSELGEFLHSCAFDVLIDPPSVVQQTPTGHIAFITFASTKCISGFCDLTPADHALLAEDGGGSMPEVKLCP